MLKTYYGIGFDIHKLIKNKKLFLGGIKISFHSGLKGHSDGDVILHANLDINLICERPKVSKYRNRIINSLSKLINLDKDQINLKCKTVEKLGLIGKEKAIACEAIVSIFKND